MIGFGHGALDELAKLANHSELVDEAELRDAQRQKQERDRDRDPRNNDPLRKRRMMDSDELAEVKRKKRLAQEEDDTDHQGGGVPETADS